MSRLPRRPYARFYALLSKEDRVAFFKKAFKLMGVSHSTFYYKAKHGNIYPSETVKIKEVLIEYGCTKEELLSMGVME